MQPTRETKVSESSQDADVPQPTEKETRPGKWSTKPVSDRIIHVFKNHSLSILIAILFVIFSLMSPDTFPTMTNVLGMALSQSVSALLALSVLLVVVAGEFDLSVGYVLGFSAVITAVLASQSGLSPVLAILAGLVCGAVFGTIGGFLVAKLGFNSLIATLGIGLAVSGLTAGVSGGRTISSNIPDLITNIARTRVLGLELAVWIVLLVAIAMYVLFAKTPLGKKIYAIGSNERVARMVGIRVSLIKVMLFVGAGVLAALAGILQLGLSGAANPNFGADLLLPAFAAVFLGSTSVRSGYFNVWGTMLAVVLLAVGFSGLSLMGVPFWTQPVFSGVALIVGVLLSRGSLRKRRQ